MIVFNIRMIPRFFLCILLLLILIMYPVSAGSETSGSEKSALTASTGEWKGVPEDFPVTRWPEDSPIRPTTYNEWNSLQEPYRFLEVERLFSAEPDKNTDQRGAMAIIVNADLRSGIQTSLDRYVSDLAADGYQAELITASGGTPEEFRAFLLTQYQQGMQGAVLIGDLPIAWYETYCWDPVDHETFPCDLYYMDLDGLWEDTDSDGMYDSHSGDVDPEIWIGRLTASPMTIYGADEATLLNNYFLKNHLYRIGQLPLADRALLYIDDDWQYSHEYWGDDIGMAYSDRTVVFDPYETVADDYEDHLDDNYELIQVCAHSDPHTHYFSTPSGSGGTTGVGTMVGIDPRAVFYNLFACSNARYVESDYMSGWYIFCQTFGLASVGSTKTGSMLNFNSFYGPFGSGYSFGEAFMAWFEDVLWEEQNEFDICWFYGMTLCGDPTLRRGMTSSPVMITSDIIELYGDGDDIPEQDETIQCRIAMTNNGAATATGVTLGLSVNDAGIAIIDDESYIGDIAPGSVLDNDADPMSFEIPNDYISRTDTLFVEISWNGGACFDTMAIEQALGRVDILLVDDDNNANVDQYYREYLDNSAIPSHTWNAAESTVTTGDLDQYGAVVWFSGGYRPDLLNTSEISALTGFLDNGGNLFLSGQGIAEQLSVSDPSFLQNYLRADYLSTGYVPLLVDIPGGLVFEYTDSIAILGAGGQSYQTNPDQITAVNGGVNELEYLTGVGPGTVSYSGSYRSVFFAFGFECIVNNNSRWADRDSLYADILDFFGYVSPSMGPRVSVVTVSPGDPEWMLDHTPDISWTYFDPGANPQEMYQVQVGSDNFWASAEMWDSGPVTGSESTVTYAGAYLECNHSYYIRVRVFNGFIWSAWKSTAITMNGVPVPTNLSPTAMEGVEDIIPALTHDRMTDPEGSPLVYDYELYEDEALTTRLAHADSVPAGTGPTMSWTVPLTLSMNEDYYWRVRTRDTIETGPWSYAAGFVVFPESSGTMCGDANSDQQVNLGDAVFLINYIFMGGQPPVPVCKGDANGDGNSDLGDVVYLIAYIFHGGPPPVGYCCDGVK